MNDAATNEFRQALGLDEFDDLPTAPKNVTSESFIAASGPLCSSSWSLKIVLEYGFNLYQKTEYPAVIWDYRGDTAAYDAAADPRPIAVVGVTWLEG